MRDASRHLVLRRSGVEAAPGAQTEAEEYFRKSIEIARQQEARPFELKAVMSLSRLRAKQGEKVEARQVLAEIYSWFTEGFDGGCGEPPAGGVPRMGPARPGIATVCAACTRRRLTCHAYG